MEPRGAHTLSQQEEMEEQASELEQMRKSEFERRSTLLDPSLKPAVFTHLPSFSASLQITTPLDDIASEPLRDQPVAERGEAELGEDQTRMSSQIGKSSKLTRHPMDMTKKERSEVQRSVKDQLSKYADEIIRNAYNNGAGVSTQNCSKFAAEVLIYARTRFYAEVAKAKAAALAAGRPIAAEPPEGPWSQRLTFENMRWLHNVKILPRTRKLRKRVLYCRSCVQKTKPFAFDGLITHCLQKHKRSLGLSKTDNPWIAEWPPTPPFHPYPKGRLAQLTQSAERPSLSLVPPLLPQAQTSTARHFDTLGHPANYTASDPLPQTLTALPHTEAFAVAPHGGSPPHPTSSLELRGKNTPKNRNQTGVSYPRLLDKVQNSKLKFMADVALYTCQSLRPVKDLPDSVAFCATVHHIAKAFEVQVGESARLEMMLDVLSEDREMEPLHGLAMLQCKPCVETGGTQQRRFEVRQLMEHFRQEHVRPTAPSLDWRTQMILLPSMSELQLLPNILAGHRAAYDTVADALPWAFDGASPAEHRPQAWGQPDNEYHVNSSTIFRREDSLGHPVRRPMYGMPKQSAGEVPSNPRHEAYHVDRATQVQSQSPHGYESIQTGYGEPHRSKRLLSVSGRGSAVVYSRNAQTEQVYTPGYGHEVPGSRSQGVLEHGNQVQASGVDFHSTLYHPPNSTRPEYIRPHHLQTPSHPPHLEDHHSMRPLVDDMSHREAGAWDIGLVRREEQAPVGQSVEECELLEVRDPIQGSYYIRREIRRDMYPHEPRTGQQPHYSSAHNFATNRVYSDTHRQTFRNQEPDERDIRFPAGGNPAHYVRHR